MIRVWLERHGWTCVRSDDEGDLYTKGNPVCMNTVAALFQEIIDSAARTKRDQRLLDSAMDFCRHDQVIRALRKQLRPCADFDRGDPSVGDYGTPMCDPDPKNPDRCAACEQRAQFKPLYLKALRGRAQAKARMKRAF